jgi:hypothetical protein
MLKRLTLLTVTAGLIVVLLSACGYFRYKKFLVGGTPRSPNPAVQIGDMWWFIVVDVEPGNNRELRDSLYKLRLNVLRGASEECSPEWESVFKSVNISHLTFQSEGGFRLGEREPTLRKVHNPCWVEFRFDSLVVPESVKVLEMKITASYSRNGQYVPLDTVIPLLKMVGKELGEGGD